MLSPTNQHATPAQQLLLLLLLLLRVRPTL
jgi:hypothetical protein